MKRFCILFAAILSLLLSCDLFTTPTNQNDTAKVTGISFSKTTLDVNIGTDEYLPIRIIPSDVQNKINLNWEYDAEAVSINPDSYGVIISGLQPQSTYIKASVNGYTATCIINVTNTQGAFIGDPYIYAGSAIVEIQPQASQNISVSLMGGSVADYNNFTWSTSNNLVADITSAMNNCVVRSYKTGTAQITASHPLAKYPFTFIVHSYTDDINEPYLTTNMNIITINKTESAVKNISIALKNSFNSEIVSRYHWEIDSNGEPPCISLSGNGNSAVVTALSNGINRIKVTHDECNYPLYILIRVTTAVQNVYITTSVSTLEITGSAAPHTVTADLAGYNSFYDKSLFVWSMPDDIDGFADYEIYENNLSITGKKNSAFKVSVSHELSDFAKTILVVLREQDGSRIDNSMYITTSQNYVQTKVGAGTTPIAVTLIGGVPGDENNFAWSVDGGENNIFVKFETPHGSIKARSALGSLVEGTLYITPLAIGSAAVSVSHPKIAYSTDISIRVYSEFAQLEEPLYINSPVSSLKKLGGASEQLSVTISGNTAPGDEDAISWSSSDPALVSFLPAAGTNVLMNVAYGQGKKQTYISISHPKAQSSKRILLLSADTQLDLDSMKAVYADQTYYRTNVNSTVNVSISSFGLEPHDIIDWSASPPGIVLVEKDPADQLSASVTGIASAMVTVSASIRNADAAPCELTFVVLPEGEDTGTISANFISTAKNALLLAEPGDSAELSVYGVNIPPDDLYLTSWAEFNPSVISVTANGASASITALDYGSTKIKVSHPNSAIDLFIDVKIGAMYSWTDELYPYITVESDVVLMVKGDTGKTIGASLVNHQAVSGFSFRLNPADSPIASVSGITSGTCIIDALEAGMCEIIVSNTYCDFEREILLVIANSPEELAGFNYLSTSQNVITLPIGSPLTVSVTVPAIPFPPSGSFSWESSDPAVASIVSSGSYAVITGGARMGTAIITVRQHDCVYPLEIIANCIDPKIAADNPYIMSPNIITLRIGDPLSSIAAELIGGFPADNAFFNWAAADPAVIDLYGSNETAQARAKREGITQIIISHPKSVTDRTILVICEPQLTVDYAISVSENIIRLSPSDSARTLTATLVNGTPADAYGFKWWADSYDIIEFNYSGNTCVITPKSAGYAYVHVSHPKSSYPRDILVQISQFSEFKFSAPSLTIAAGSQSFVNMQIPAYNFTARIDYETIDTASGANASHIATASGTNAVCIVNAHEQGHATIQAKLINASNGIVQATAQLLVNVTPSATPETYIKYSGPTIITVEKGASKQISASLEGLGVTAENSNSLNMTLQWKSSDYIIDNSENPYRAINISPKPSNSGIATNNSIQITGLNDGAQCTVTISHELSNTEVTLYIIVPGSTAANISLSTGSIRYCIVGDPIFSIDATITNPEKNDYELLDWNLEQDNDIVNISGSGKKINVLPKNPGTATITATVPSSSRTASVTIVVEPPQFISLSHNYAAIFPGQTFSISYSVSPPELIDCVSWNVSDTFYVQPLNNTQTGVGYNGTMEFLGWIGNGTVTVTASLHPPENKNITIATATMTIKNGWDNSLRVNTASIRHIPEKSSTLPIAQNPFNIPYEVNPYIADIYVTIPNPNLTLEEGTFSKIENGVYIITQDYLENIDLNTGTGYGFIQLCPAGEAKTAIYIQAHNLHGTNPATGEPLPTAFPNNQIAVKCDIYYSAYTFDIQNFSSDSKYSSFDPAISALIIGDGSTTSFSLKALEPNADPVFPADNSETPYFVKNSSEQLPLWVPNIQDKDNTYLQQNLITVTRGQENQFTIRHVLDYTGSGTPWGLSSPSSAEDSNETQVGFVYAGYINIPYRKAYLEFDDYFRLQVYVSIRNCLANGPY